MTLNFEYNSSVFVNVVMDRNNTSSPRSSVTSATTSVSPLSHSSDATFDDADNPWLAGVLFDIRMCFLPVIVAGTVANILNFAVLSRPEMRRLSTAVYLLALAVADMGVMYVELFRVWFEWAGLIPPDSYFTDNYCRAANYSNGIVRDFSNWLVACLAVERLIIVAFPYRAKVYCTIHKARLTTVVLLITISLAHTHYLVFSQAQKWVGWVCWEQRQHSLAPAITGIVEFIVGSLVAPVVFLLNVALICSIRRRRHSVFSKDTKTKDQRLLSSRRLTRMLLLLALIFVLCETPRIVMQCILKFISRTPERRIVLNITFVISGLHHACNFFIYIVSSARFRAVFYATFGCSQHQRNISRAKENSGCCYGLSSPARDEGANVVSNGELASAQHQRLNTLTTDGCNCSPCHVPRCRSLIEHEMNEITL